MGRKAEAAASVSLEKTLNLAVPVRELPGVVVPAGELDDELVLHRGDEGPGHDRDDDVIVDCEVVALDEQRRALHRIEFGLRRLVRFVVLGALPARDVT